MDSEIRLRFSNHDDLVRYERDCAGNEESRCLSRSFSAVCIHPVEPVNLPEALTRFLEISFPPLILPAGSEQTVYVKFPIEIGIFLESAGKCDSLDVFSLAPTKFSLYGTPSSGVITRFYRSGISTVIPDTDPLREGVIRLTIRNQRTETTIVGRAVFDSGDMSIFYSNRRVAMTATLEIYSEYLARTLVADEPPEDCPNRSINMYPASQFSIPTVKGYFMEAGTK
ncbi:MAG: DUF432 domain-containing protein [Methanoregula sp.]